MGRLVTLGLSLRLDGWAEAEGLSDGWLLEEGTFDGFPEGRSDG